MAHSLGAIPNVLSSSNVSTVSRCDRAQQSCAPMILNFTGSAGVCASVGGASGSRASSAGVDGGRGGGVGRSVGVATLGSGGAI
eukprot:1561815-Pyramimonas_sp.AAC.1